MIPPNLRATAATSRRSLRTLRGTAATAPAAAHHAPPYRYAGSRLVDFDDLSVTENTRCAYPLQAIPNAKLPAIGSHPTNVVLLTCDGFGVLPPVSKLTKEKLIEKVNMFYEILTAASFGAHLFSIPKSVV